ncbi:MAG: hypothetical protein ACI92G_002507 [Candidatus Pelagisphaera sp.]|jgi:hypothetical protein
MKIPGAKEIRISLLLMTLFSLSSFRLSASDSSQDPSGTWVWESEIQGETKTNSLKVRMEGETFVGEYKRGDIEATIRNGKSNSGGIAFELPFKRNDGSEWVVICEAKIDGNDLSGSYSFEGNNGVEENEWNAKREVAVEDLVGTWNLHIDGPDGVTYTPDAIFELSDESLVGTYNAASIERKLPMSMVELNGEKLSFAVDQPDLKLNYVGTVSGKGISGNLEFDISGNSGDVAFTGTLAE